MASPASVLGLSKNWKLTLPTGPPEIEQPRLMTYTDKNFRVSGGDCVLFTASVAGATTAHSDYPRSELREMVANGTKPAAWSNRSGTHSMLLDCAFMHLPGGKPHVVLGQVHDAADDVTVCRLEGSKLYITKGDNTHYDLIDSNYVLGTRFTIRFKATTGGIFYDYNDGDQTGTVSGNYSGLYFKAGCYTQANRSNGSGYGQTAIWGIAMNGAALPGDPPTPPAVVRPPKPTPPVDDENPCGG
jgi:poly(beta-D-mannuronate) lyase